MGALLDFTEKTAGKRPVFVTVLCILTWIGSGLLLLQSLKLYSSAMERKAHLQQNIDRFPGMMNESYMELFDRQIVHALVQGTACLLCIAGAVIVWRLLKAGFFTYVAGQLLSVAGFVLYYNALLEKSPIKGLVLLIVSVFPVLFIVLYGLNYKHLKWTNN